MTSTLAPRTLPTTAHDRQQSASLGIKFLSIYVTNQTTNVQIDKRKVKRQEKLIHSAKNKVSNSRQQLQEGGENNQRAFMRGNNLNFISLTSLNVFA